MTTILLTIFMLLLVAIGAAIGSFLNVVIWRVPEKMSLTTPPSHCPKCNSPVRWFDNIPVLSWFILRGKCRDCKEPISIRYPMVEALSALVTLIVAWAFLLGNWTGLKSQPFFWEDYSNWTIAWQENIALSSDDLNEIPMVTRQTSAPFATDNAAASEEFLRLLRSTSLLIVFWTILADLALMIGFVEWDRGYCTPSLLLASICILIIIAIFTLLINDPGKFLDKSMTYVYSLVGGLIGVLLPTLLVSKEERPEFLMLGGIWGIGAGYILAVPGAVILGTIGLIIRNKTKRQTLGLFVFGALVLLLLTQVFGVVNNIIN